MTTLCLYVGLDCHSSVIQVCLLDQDGSVLFNRRVANSVAAVARAIKPKSLVVSAIANRWVRWLYHQLKSEALAA